MPRNLSSGKTALARAKRRGENVCAANNRGPKPRKRTRPHRHRTVVLHAIKGCRGLWGELARRLDCSLLTIQAALRQPGWESVLQTFEEERLKALDGCADNVFNIAEWDEDSSVRLKANTFILEKMHPDFKPTSTVKVEGGDKPIQVQHVVLQIPEEILDQPLDTRIKVLEMAEAKERSLEENQDVS